MARKKKNDETASIFLGIIFIIIVAVVIVTPIFLFTGFVYYFFAFMKKNKLLNNNMSDFWLNTDEKNEFKENLRKLIHVNTIVDHANNRGIKAGIARNQDGSFSARSNLGKEVKATLVKYLPIQDKYNEIVDEITLRPLGRWQEFDRILRRYHSFKWALFAWCLTFACTIIFVDEKAAIIATVISIATYLIVGYCLKDSTKNYSPKPDLVTLDNIDEY